MKTICWYCENASGKCSWSSIHPKPVEGWDAEPTRIRIDGKTFEQSFIVKKCPYYKLDKCFAKYTKMGITKLSEFLNMADKTIKKKSQSEIRKILAERGYEVVFIRDEKRMQYYIKQLDLGVITNERLEWKF